MSILDDFWALVDAQLAELKTAQSADDVLRILACGEGPDKGFFGGGGGDGSVYGSLCEAGWSTVWFRAGYFWAMRSPDGRSAVTYVEGDVFRGVQKPLYG